MSRLPSAAASRNISACSAQAMSQVGCRLMVASSAKTSRPLAPAAWGDIARALATKAAISSEADGVASGSLPALPGSDFCAEGTAPADFGWVGSPDISTRQLQQVLCGPGQGGGQCAVTTRNTGRSPMRFQIGRMQRLEFLGQFLIGAYSATGPGSVIFGTLVSTGLSGLSSSRNLSSMPWIDAFAASGPVSRMSLCWKP